MTQRHAVRGRVLTFTGDPAEVGLPPATATCRTGWS